MEQSDAAPRVSPDWDAPRAAQRRDVEAMSLRERLEWLERATRAARFLAAAPVVAPPGPAPATDGAETR